MARKIVNVASVTQRSPFRYPGGKTWRVPYVRAWLKSLPSLPSTFLEPFVGGGIISLTVGFEKLASRVHMVELDEDVSAVWKTILGRDAKWLANRITEFDLTIDNVRAELERPTKSIKQMAFNTILRNRTFHGGIMAHGSGMIKHGEAGKGIKSRWYPKTLQERILSIAEIADRFEFYEGDGIEELKSRVCYEDQAVFIDPPYTAGGQGKRAGRRLYKHSDLDHDLLFDVAKGIKGSFLMTYDNDPEVLSLAHQRGFDTALVPMKNTHHAEMNELLISKNLGWIQAMVKTSTGYLPGFETI